MGRDRNFPTFFSKVHAKNFTPHPAILFSLIIVVAMSVSLHIEDVASAADIMFLLLFLQVNITLIRLRKKRPDLDRGFWTPFFPYLTILGIVLLFALAVYMFTYSPLGWLVTGCWIGIGLVIYKAYASKREIAHIQKMEALERLEKKEYRVLVAVSNMAAAARLSGIAVAVARRNNAEILFLHVIEVREHQALEAGLQGRERALEFMEKASETVRASGLNVRSILKVARSISQGIVDVAVDEKCSFIILSRQKDPTFLERLFSSVIDSVLQKSPCEVAVLHGDLKSRTVRNILIPYSADIHTRLAIEVAPALQEHFQSTVTLGMVMGPDISPVERAVRLQSANDRLKEYNLPARVETVVEEGVLQGVLKLSHRSDLILMAGRTGDFLELLLRQSLVQQITEETDCPVLWVKEYEERGSFWLSLLKSSVKESEHHE